MQPKKIAIIARDLAADKKAEDPLVLDVGDLTSFSRYFVLTHGNSDRHVKAIAWHIIDSLKDKKEKPLHIEGMETGQWVLIDYGAVIVHIFHRDIREFYNLERLWGEAPRL